MTVALAALVGLAVGGGLGVVFMGALTKGKAEEAYLRGLNDAAEVVRRYGKGRTA